ncbi:hypothetical protein MJO29_008095 [Puccinia striiformis f. sp. tritici]|nr:hypothetical protein MJO29_008095 [Puccinia striiformis f. sp. tritici]
MDVSEPSLSTQLTVLLETLQNLTEKYEWPTLQESGQEKEELEEKNKLLDKLDQYTIQVMDLSRPSPRSSHLPTQMAVFTYLQIKLKPYPCFSRLRKLLVFEL